jgi:hypothetical protein
MENFPLERKELGGGVDAKKPKTRQLVDEKNEPPSLTTRSLSPLFSSQKTNKSKNSGPRSRAFRSSACTPSRRHFSTRYEEIVIRERESKGREGRGLEEDEQRRRRTKKTHPRPSFNSENYFSTLSLFHSGPRRPRREALLADDASFDGRHPPLRVRTKRDFKASFLR